MKKLSLLIALSVVFLAQSCTVKKVKNITKITFDTKGVITIAEADKGRFFGSNDFKLETDDGHLTISGGSSESMATLFLSESTTKELESIELKDGGIYCDTLHLQNDNLKISVSGSANFAGFVVTNNASINLSNYGEMVLSGSGDNLTMVMKNYSKYTSPTCEWQNANVSITDTAKCTIKVANKLTVDAGEEANLGYIGVTDSSFTVSGNAKVFRFPVEVK